MIDRYREYIDKLDILRDEEKRLKNEWGNLFYNDVMSELKKYHPIEEVETKSLRWKNQELLIVG